MLRLFATSLTLLILANRAWADFDSCIGAVAAALNSCDSAAHSAKNQADQVARRQMSSVNGDSLNQAADREAAVTRQISEILAGGRAVCDQSARRCSGACTGADAEFAQSCRENIAEYQEELNPGIRQNVVGHQGSVTSGNDSSSRSGVVARGPGLAGQKPGEAKSAVANSTAATGGANAPSASSGSNILQRNQADPTASRGANYFQAQSASVSEDAPPAAALQIALDRALSGGAISEEVRSYCGNRAGYAVCDKIRVKEFCALPAHGMCPSCSDQGDEFSSKLQGQALAQACAQGCVHDPYRGPEMANLCRNTFAGAGTESAVSTEHVANAGAPPPARRPSAHRAPEPTEIGGPFTSSLFRIHSIVIRNLCDSVRLDCNSTDHPD